MSSLTCSRRTDDDPPGPCRSCGQPIGRPVLDLGPQPVADSLLERDDQAETIRPLRLRRCEACLLLQLDDTAPTTPLRHGHGAAFSSTILAHHADLARSIAGLDSRKDRRVLDIASEAGHLLARFRDRGMTVLGVEPDAADAEMARSAGINTVVGQFGSALARDLVAEHGGFDVILVNHALAHAANLNDLLAGCALALAPSGVLVIEFHHALGIVTDGQFDVLAHAHHTYWSLLALDAALGRHGLVVRDAYKIPIHGGSVVALAGLGQAPADTGGPVARAKIRRSVANAEAVRQREREAGLDNPGRLEGLAVTADRVRDDLRAFLSDERRRGRRVVGYGAPARGTTLLNFAGLGTDDLEFTVDRSPAKQGRLLPGCRIPIRPVEALLAARPATVLILPWPLATEIVQGLPAVSGWGGEFVVALPRLGRVE